MTRRRRAAILGVTFCISPYLAAHLLGHFDLMDAWVLVAPRVCVPASRSHQGRRARRRAHAGFLGCAHSADATRRSRRLPGTGGRCAGCRVRSAVRVGDALSAGSGAQDRRILFDATQHEHPLVGGYIARMPVDAAQRYLDMPLVGALLRLQW